MSLSDIFGGRVDYDAVFSRRANQVILAALMRNSAATSTAIGVDEGSERRIIISLTTFAKRIDDVYLTIESLLRQSLKPNHIVLWLSREEFSPDDVPAALRLQEERGLKIKFCDRDIGPYKKIIPSLHEFSDFNIITVDDDIIYPYDLVDKLWRSYQKDPGVIHACRVHKMLHDKNGVVLPYKKWERGSDDIKAGMDIYPVGVGGVFYFPGCFSKDVFDEASFMRLSPMADDIWLKAMSLKAGTLSKRVVDERPWDARYILIDGSQKYALKRGNKSRVDGNDVKIRNVFSHYELPGRV